MVFMVYSYADPKFILSDSERKQAENCVLTPLAFFFIYFKTKITSGFVYNNPTQHL